MYFSDQFQQWDELLRVTISVQALQFTPTLCRFSCAFTLPFQAICVVSTMKPQVSILKEEVVGFTFVRLMLKFLM